MANKKFDILVICGSLREGSFNRMVARTLYDLAPPRLALRDAPEFGTFPIYNADVQERDGFPSEVVSFGEAVRKSDGVIIVSPEYNFSIPGGLKNALDWVSRLDNQPFAGKPVALQSASPSPLGGGRVQYHLRQAMVFLDALVLNKPEIFVSAVSKKVDDETGKVTDETTRKFLREQLQAFADFIDQVGEERAQELQRKRA